MRDAKAKKKKKLNVLARCLNSEEGLEACDRHDEENRQEVAKKAETAACKLVKGQERVRARAECEPIEAYTSALSTKNKPDLQDIAEALAISKDGTKTNLQNHINAHFDAHPRFKEDPKYLGLFVHHSQKRPAWAISNDQNSPPDETNGPPSNCPCHDPEPGPSALTMPQSFSQDLTNATPQHDYLPPAPHSSYHSVPNHTYHLDYPFHGPPHINSEGTHHQPTTHNSYTNSTFSVHNSYHYLPPSS